MGTWYFISRGYGRKLSVHNTFIISIYTPYALWKLGLARCASYGVNIKVLFACILSANFDNINLNIDFSNN